MHRLFSLFYLIKVTNILINNFTRYFFFFFKPYQISSSIAEITCTGPAATSKPANPPPITRPSGAAKEMLIPPDLLFVNPFSVVIYEPDKERISNRPYRSIKISASKFIFMYLSSAVTKCNI